MIKLKLKMRLHCINIYFRYVTKKKKKAGIKYHFPNKTCLSNLL